MTTGAPEPPLSTAEIIAQTVTRSLERAGVEPPVRQIAKAITPNVVKRFDAILEAGGSPLIRADRVCGVVAITVENQ